MLSSGSINNRKSLNLFFAVLIAVILCFAVKYRFYGDDGKAYANCIDGDGKGYYAYLPAVFIYHDLSFSFFEKDATLFRDQYANNFLQTHNGKNVDKYTCGEALLLIPFFILATFCSGLLHLPIDGYNPIYNLFSAIGGLFYGLMGLLFVKKYLQKYNLSNVAIAMGLTAIALGTNMLNYMVRETSMSHMFSFAMISWHVFLVKKYFDTPSLKTIILIGITLGLIILIRPVNGIIVFSYPFLMDGNISRFKIKDNVKNILIIGLLATIIVSIQLVVWKMGTGNYFVYSYKNEGFYFNQLPHIFDYLFSFRKGAFIYSPVLLFAFLGLCFLRKNRKQCLLLVLFLILVIYIQSSWWSWFYGDSFGARPLVDFYIFFALLIAVTFSNLKSVLKITSLLLFIGMILLHQVFFYQFHNWIITPDSMTFDKFKFIFLKTDKKYAFFFKTNPEEFYHPNGINIIDSASVDFTNKENKATRFLYDEKNICQNGYDLSNDYRQPKIIFTEDSTWFNKARFVEFFVEYLEPQNDSAACDVFFAVECIDKNEKQWFTNYSALAEKFNHTPNKYVSCFERLKIGISINAYDKVNVYLFNHNKRRLLIKNLKVRVVEAAS